MEHDERIALRDELFEQLQALGVIVSFKNMHQLYSKVLKNVLAINIALKSKFDVYLAEFATFEEARYCIVHHDDPDEHLCPVCGKRCSFYAKGNTSRYNYTCSRKCGGKLGDTPTKRVKARSTNMERRGVEYPAQDPEVRKRIQVTNNTRYGVSCTLQSADAKAKSCATNMRRRGVMYATQCEEVNYHPLKQAACPCRHAS